MAKLLDLIHDIFRIARHQTEVGAIYEKIKVLQDDCSNQHRIAFGLHGAFENAVATKEIEVNLLDFRAQTLPSSPRTNLDALILDREPQQSWTRLAVSWLSGTSFVFNVRDAAGRESAATAEHTYTKSEPAWCKPPLPRRKPVKRDRVASIIMRR